MTNEELNELEAKAKEMALPVTLELIADIREARALVHEAVEILRFQARVTGNDYDKLLDLAEKMGL